MRQYAAKLILIAESRYDFTEKRTPFKVFWLWRRRSEADDARAGTYTAGHGMTDTIGYDEAKTVDAGVTNCVVDYAVHAYVWYRGMDEYGGASVTQVKNICCLGYEDIYGHKSDCMDGVDLPNDTGNGGKWRVRMPDGHGAETAGKRNPDGRLREYKYAREIAQAVVDRLSTDGFYILRKSQCAACLTENMFQDNMKDVAWLLSAEGRESIVRLHVDGIKRYIEKIKR